MIKKLNMVLLVASALTLAAIGCLFSCELSALGSSANVPSAIFARQLVANILGLAFFAGIYALGWKRCLRFAPWMMLASLILIVIACFMRPVGGLHRWLVLGPIHLNVRTVFLFVGAFFLAWVVGRFRFKPWQITLVFAAILGFFLSLILLYVLRRLNITSLVYFQDQWRMAIAVSSWFGSADRSLRLLSFPHTTGVAAGVAMTLGKVFLLLAVGLLAIIGGALLSCLLRITDRPRRLYLGLFAFLILFPSSWCFLQGFGLAHIFGFSFTFLTYGGTDVLMSWLGLGLALAAIREEDTEDSTPLPVPVPPVAAWIFAGILFVGLLVAWACAPLPKDAHYREPLPNGQELGPYGTAYERGRLLSAEGEVLAQSVPQFDIHADPVYAFVIRKQPTNSVIERVSEGLKLPPEKVAALYARRGRFIPVMERADEAAVSWCKTPAARRCGVIAFGRQSRAYSLGADAAHVTGACLSQGLSGSMGLEYVCNDALVGKDGYMSSTNTYAANLITGRPRHGGSVTTTVRAPMQKAVADLLAAYVETNGAESAWAMAVSLPRGEIVAMSSWPTFDPADKSPLDYSDETSPLRNRAVQDLFEPGALLKPLACALALDVGKLTVADLEDVSSVSNVCQTLGTNVVWQGFKRLHVDARIPDSRLYGEERGRMLDPLKGEPWVIKGFDSGRGILMTGAQIVQAYATLANGGMRVYPHLVTSVADVDGKTVWTYPKQSAERFVALESAAAVTKMLQSQRAGVPYVAGVAAAGTGSVLGRDALYAGYFPAANPAYVLVVSFRRADKAGQCDPALVRVAFERMATEILSLQRK